MAKHYLPAASGAEERLLEDLVREHPALLAVTRRPGKGGDALAFEVKSLSLERYVFFLIARLRRSQHELSARYHRPPATRFSRHANRKGAS